MGLQRDRLQTIEGWHSTTELDAGHLLSPSGLPPPTKMLQVPPAQGASDPVVPVGVLKAQRGPSSQGHVFQRERIEDSA